MLNIFSIQRRLILIFIIIIVTTTFRNNQNNLVLGKKCNQLLNINGCDSHHHSKKNHRHHHHYQHHHYETKENQQMEQYIVPVEKKTTYVSTHDVPRHIANFKLNSGFGNYLFAYSSILGIAKMRHAEPCGSIQPILTKVFENTFTLKPCPKNIKFVTIREHGTSTYNTKFKEYNLSQSINPIQYLQSWKYFDNIKPTILKQFQIKHEIKMEVQKWIDFVAGNTLTVGLHMRFGDMEWLGMLRMPRLSWYKMLFANFQKQTTFIIISDDIPKATKYLETIKDKNKHKFITSPFKDMKHDFALLTLCDIPVSSRGTFSWWAIYLNGLGIHYAAEFNLLTAFLHNPHSDLDYYPPFSTSLISKESIIKLEEKARKRRKERLLKEKMMVVSTNYDNK